MDKPLTMPVGMHGQWQGDGAQALATYCARVVTVSLRLAMLLAVVGAVRGGWEPLALGLGPDTTAVPVALESGLRPKFKLCLKFQHHPCSGHSSSLVLRISRLFFPS